MVVMSSVVFGNINTQTDCANNIESFRNTYVCESSLCDLLEVIECHTNFREMD